MRRPKEPTMEGLFDKVPREAYAKLKSQLIDANKEIAVLRKAFVSQICNKGCSACYHNDILAHSVLDKIPPKGE